MLISSCRRRYGRRTSTSGSRVCPVRSLFIFILTPADTLIVWTEPNGADYALSFQDPEGCLEVWNFICEVQQHMTNGNRSNSVDAPNIGPEHLITSAHIQRSGGQLPPPRLEIITDIDRAIKGLPRQGPMKERLCEYIMQAVGCPVHFGTIVKLFPRTTSRG